MASGDIVLAITGASGSRYGTRLLEVLLRAGRTVHLVISPAAGEVFERELGGSIPLSPQQFDPKLLLGAASDGLDLSRLH